MLKRLSILLGQLHDAGLAPQITLLPGQDGSMAIIAAFQQAGETHEIAQAFTAAEIDGATDEQVYTAIETLAAAVWCEAAEARGEDMTPENAMERLRAAAAQSPRNEAMRLLDRLTSPGQTYG